MQSLNFGIKKGLLPLSNIPNTVKKQFSSGRYKEIDLKNKEKKIDEKIYAKVNLYHSNIEAIKKLIVDLNFVNDGENYQSVIDKLKTKIDLTQKKIDKLGETYPKIKEWQKNINLTQIQIEWNVWANDPALNEDSELQEYNDDKIDILQPYFIRKWLSVHEKFDAKIECEDEKTTESNLAVKSKENSQSNEIVKPYKK